MKKNCLRKPHRGLSHDQQSGFSLIEVLSALAIFSVVVLAFYSGYGDFRTLQSDSEARSFAANKVEIFVNKMQGLKKKLHVIDKNQPTTPFFDLQNCQDTSGTGNCSKVSISTYPDNSLASRSDVVIESFCQKQTAPQKKFFEKSQFTKDTIPCAATCAADEISNIKISSAGKEAILIPQNISNEEAYAAGVCFDASTLLPDSVSYRIYVAYPAIKHSRFEIITKTSSINRSGISGKSVMYLNSN